MRELKFRVWNKLSKKFCLNTEDGYFGQDEIFAKGIFTIGSWDKHDVIQQYTGIKDKTGKDIYEGDIVRYVEKMHEHGDSQVLTATVIYDNDYGAWGLGKKEVHNYFLDFTVLKNTVEVLGNIFENKDLLK